MNRPTSIAFVLGLLGTAVGGCSAAHPYERGQEAMARGDHAEAVRQLTRATERDPDSAAAWRALARAHFRSGNLSRARLAIARSDELQPEMPQTILLRAQIQTNQGERSGAQLDASWVAQRTRDPRMLQEAAIVFARLGESEAALDAGWKAIRFSDGDPAAYANLGVLAVELRRLDQARRAFEAGHRAHPRDVGLGQAYAAFLMSTQQFARAREVYESLLPLHPRPGLVHLALALLTHQAGELTQALSHARAAVRAEGERRADVHYTLGIVLRDLGRLQEARDVLRRGRRRFPADAGLAQLADDLG